MSSVAHRGYVHVGMDVSKDAIAVAVLPPDRDVAEVDKIFHDEESVRRLIKRLGRSGVVGVGRDQRVWAAPIVGARPIDLVL